MDKIFGIDLGTTYSCIAYVDEHGKPVVVPNFENDSTTPSVVCFEDKESIIVGKEAKNMLKTDHEKVVAFIKRNMGNPNYLFSCNNIKYKPEEISAYILKKLVKDASENLGIKIKDVVITCPAYFGDSERKATEKAGEIAGLNVMSLINEPTAAALAFGIDKVIDQTVLVYDLGGGTFDVTMIQIKPQLIKVVVTGGDHNLGGKDWDDILITFLAEQFKEKTNIKDDILSDPKTLGELQIEAEKAKITLSTRPKKTVRILYGKELEEIEISREKFEELTKDLANKTIMLTNQMLDDAKKEKGICSFDKILLVGASTKMPQIKKILENNYPNIPIEPFEPEASVAKGASLYGWQIAVNKMVEIEIEKLTGKKDGDISEIERNKVEQKVADKTGFSLPAVKRAKIKPINVISKSFGVLAYVNETEQKVVNMITKQTEIPVENSQNFSTHKANQDNIEVVVYENELSDNQVDISMSKEIVKGLIEGIPSGLPAGSPIQVTFKVNDEGRLDIQAIELTGKKVLNLTVETTSVISGQELEDAKARSNAIKLS